MKLPAKLEPSQVTAICDTREQLPLCLEPLRVQSGTLDTGDYSLSGCEHIVRIERKSLDDLLGCVGRDRERFDREVQRLLAYPVRVIES
jgi:DNA excision repair protein ERCC-4